MHADLFILGLDFIDFSKIDFSAESLDKTSNVLIIRIRNVTNAQIVHNLPKINRCCKASHASHDKHLSFPGKDNIKRISCDIHKKEFLQEYVIKRRAIILKGCHRQWPARRWTFKGIDILSKTKLLVCTKTIKQFKHVRIPQARSTYRILCVI